VFREGLECILVLSALTASMVGANRVYRRPIAAGVGLGLAATIVTWFIAVGIVSDLSSSVSALNLQAATGLLAVVVLLVVMNWFFHKVYWCGWISMHSRKKKDLMASASEPGASMAGVVRGLALLGFASLYREGFEVVLFLQTYYLKLGGRIVALGAALGLILTGMVAVLTFVANRRLPYRKMLIATGIMLGGVLLVMVGEQAQEMQLAHWIPTTTLTGLAPLIPAWAGLWFSVFPTVQTLTAQVVAGAVVVGSYFYARRQSGCVTCPSGGSSATSC
jgi:high-affinity iron transporter